MIFNITLPIHYTFVKKTKKNQTVLLGLNWYRNVHYISNNKVKKYISELVGAKCKKIKADRIKVVYKVYVSRRNTDGHNVRSVMEKYVLDAFIKCGLIKDDSLDFVPSTRSYFYLDKDNPRIEVEVYKLKDINDKDFVFPNDLDNIN